MEAKEVIQKILSEAEAQATAIAAKARQQDDAAVSELNTELAEFNRQTDELAMKAGEEKKARILAAARMAASREMLAEKRQLMDELFDAFRKRLDSIPDHEYRALMADLMKKAVLHGDEEVLVGRDEHRIDQGLVNEVNSSLGDKGRLKFSSKRANCDKGFVLARGDVRTNVSVAVLIEQARTEIENKLAARLFH
ncbi:MAG TPA: V-type ATP synthase subunit E [Sedimentisphaerales bacterium]|nr:V-type ATP synthase subunit E [Sedimentisphaerales bacterium]